MIRTHSPSPSSALTPADSEEDKALRRAMKRSEHEEAVRQKRWLFNAALPVALVILLGSAYVAFWGHDEAQKSAGETLKVLLPGVLGFLLGRARPEGEHG